ncbi:MAG: choline ABC transporter ATP-binding protein [Granulosicoccus sp.]
MSENNTAVSMQHIDVLFGPKSGRKEALQLLDQGKDRDQILSQTGMVLGVADASLEVPKGSISVLMGLSGSGKSSLLRCVNGLNTVTRGVLNVQTEQGAVNVAACKGRALRDLRRSNLAMVFQQFGLLPWATVRDNIGFGLSVRGESKALIEERVQQQLSLVGLDAWADKAIHTLSGGMQQRVGLARAFATDADILLMDEPFSALDPLIREHLQDELLALQERLKKTILFVSHDLDEALKLGNRISIMEGGRIVQTGTVDDIVFNPANDYVRRFVANINPLSVLQARNIMKPMVMDEHKNLVHSASAVCVIMQAGKPVKCLLNGRQYDIQQIDSISKAPDVNDVVVCVHENTPIKELLARSSSSSLCTLVANVDDHVVGVIETQDLCAALSD